jgi:DNA-binding response OmpR family regulator
MKWYDLKVLIVEDELISVEYLKEILTTFGIQTIFEAQSANEAINIAKEHSLDFIFMDINIKGNIDGIQCATHINTLYFVPLIFTTAYVDNNTMMEASCSNAFGYVIKPFVPSDIKAALMVAKVQLQRLIQEEQKANDTSSSQTPNKIVLAKEYQYHLDSKTLTHLNIPIRLTKKEMQLLDTFCKNLNQNISYDYLKEWIWNEKNISDSAIRDVIFRLKKKVPDMDLNNVPNFGYVLRPMIDTSS